MPPIPPGGIPPAGPESFGSGFDHLISLQVQEIQIGILKRLRGTPISMHTKEWQMVYSPDPPYEILQNKNWSFTQLSKMRKIARYWDIVANSGRFVLSLPLILEGRSPFWSFFDFSDWL